MENKKYKYKLHGMGGTISLEVESTFPPAEVIASQLGKPYVDATGGFMVDFVEVLPTLEPTEPTVDTEE